MNNLRTYGTAPYQAAVIHGGPGAPGEMAPVARELSSLCGVLEPLQTKTTLREQLEELHTIVKENGHLPITLIGYSWGAMLSYIFTAHYPSLVKKLILISSGVYEDQYAASIMKTRLNRLSEGERTAFDALERALHDPTNTDKNATFAQLGELISKADSYDPLPHKNEIIECQYALYESVWKDVQELRRSGELVAIGRNIRCPVVAIHGDYDPHPPDGIKTPLSNMVNDFHFILLKHCGHHPWYEKDAKEPFYTLLKQELR
jgi:pimeloyl-ACP methyl ester carboxylesterase